RRRHTRFSRDWSSDVCSSDLSPDKVITFGNKVLFQGESAEYGTEPWITDGTTAGTFMLKDIHPGPADSPSPTVVGGKFTIRGDKIGRASCRERGEGSAEGGAD